MRARRLLLGLGVLAGCYGVPPLAGPYRCAEDSSCTEEGMVCDDGVCCRPDRAPLCLSYALDGGTCIDGGTATLYYADIDNDGFGNSAQPKLFCRKPVTESYVETAGDCNDNPSAGGAVTYPGAPEQCDGFDNDCDGVPDNGLDRHWYFLDEDGDHFGASDAGIFVCKPRTGYVEPWGDCAPRDPNVFPGAPEVCNNKDDNCNGVIDEGGPVWYRDVDGDGYGISTLSKTACTKPLGYADKAGDCNDSNAAINPGALDLCDGIDNNCNKLIDERPDCGGPANLLSQVGVLRGASSLKTVWNGQPTGCLKGTAELAPDSFSGTTWVGAGATSHVAWFEAPRSWDLSKASSKLTLRFTQFQTGSVADPLWSAHKQPVILLCAGATHNRYVGILDGGATPLMPYGGYDAVAMMPVPGGAGWVVGAGSNLSDLQHVKRVEIVIQPNKPTTGSPSFDLTFSALGF